MGTKTEYLDSNSSSATYQICWASYLIKALVFLICKRGITIEQTSKVVVRVIGNSDGKVLKTVPLIKLTEITEVSRHFKIVNMLTVLYLGSGRCGT